MAGLPGFPVEMAFLWPPQAYLWFKALHIVGVDVWFAGLFYLVRLFIYHREAEELEPPLRDAFHMTAPSEGGEGPARCMAAAKLL